MAEQLNDVWDTIEDKEYVTFDKDKNNNVIDIKFIDDMFNPKVSAQFGNLQYEFEVIEEKDREHVKIFNPSSSKLMRKLKENRPLGGKAFKIERFGEGFSTDYEIALVTWKEQEKLKG